MRLFEIEAPTLKIEATKRFMKNASTYLRGYAQLEKNLNEFLNFKIKNPRTRFNNKDTLLTGGIIKNTMHCHLVHGKVILLYRVTNDTLLLIDIVEHTLLDAQSNINKLGTFIDSLDQSDFVPYQMRVRGEPAAMVNLPEDQKSELEGLFYEMAVSDRDIIQSALENKFDEIKEFIELTVPQQINTVIASYGGPEGFKDHLKAILKSIGG